MKESHMELIFENEVESTKSSIKEPIENSEN